MSLYKLWILFWVARWVETGEKKTWQVKPIKMCIKARSFKAMRSSQCKAAPLLSMAHFPWSRLALSHILFGECLSQPHLVNEWWEYQYEAQVGPGTWQGDSHWEKSRHRIWQSPGLGPCSSLCQMAKQKDWTGCWSHPGTLWKMEIPPLCVHQKKYKQSYIKRYSKYEMIIGCVCSKNSPRKNNNNKKKT